jgi:hypothetical protein
MKMAIFWDVAPCSFQIMADVSEVLTASVIRTIAVRTSDFVSMYRTTPRYILEDSQLQKKTN